MHTEMASKLLLPSHKLLLRSRKLLLPASQRSHACHESAQNLVGFQRRIAGFVGSAPVPSHSRAQVLGNPVHPVVHRPCHG